MRKRNFNVNCGLKKGFEFHLSCFICRYILRDVRPHIPKGYIYTLHDIGLVINKLMGGAYRQVFSKETQ